MHGRLLAAAFVVHGCGRFAFDPLVDANQSGVDSAATTCLPSFVFCDDFDRTALLGPWDSLMTERGMLEIEAASGNETPGALRVVLPPQVIGPGPRLITSLASPATETRLRFDVQFDGFDPSKETDLLWLRWEPPPPPCSALGVYIVKTTADVLAVQETYENCGGVVYHTIGSLDSAWHRYELVINHGEQRIAATRDGVTVLSIEALEPLPATAQSVHLGGPAVISGIVTTWTYRFDNLVVKHD